MENRFEKYILHVKKRVNLQGSHFEIVDVDTEAWKHPDEAFVLFKKLFDSRYGSIHEKENLIAIHTGGWSENEVLISEFQATGWWFLYHKITKAGGHYYFNTDRSNTGKEWKVVAQERLAFQKNKHTENETNRR